MTGMEEKYGGRERVWHPRTVSYSFSNSPKWPDWHVIRVNPEIFWNWVTNFWCVCWCQRGLCFHLKRFPPKHKTWPKKKVKSLQFSCSGVSDSLWPHGLQHSRPHCPSPIPGAYSNSSPSSQLCHPTILSSAVAFSSSVNLSQYQGLFKWVSSSHQVATVLEFQLQHKSFQWIFRTDLL